LNENNSLRGANNGAESEPGTCKSTTEEVHAELSNIQIYQHPLSIETDVSPVQINTALNREGVKLPFNQSYQFKVTTNPLGKHYITSRGGIFKVFNACILLVKNTAARALKSL
jgi:hypothetical protein